LEAIGRVDTAVVAQAKEAVIAGQAVEVDVAVSIRDKERTEAAVVGFTVAIRPKRRATA
jgi:hypothetical protein